MEFRVRNGSVKVAGKWPRDKIGAIKASIAKWEAISRSRTKVHCPGNGCALCRLYHDGLFVETCVRCPVYKLTGESECYRTPFAEYQSRKIQFRDAARAEVAFLKAVLILNGG